MNENESFSRLREVTESSSDHQAVNAFHEGGLRDMIGAADEQPQSPQAAETTDSEEWKAAAKRARAGEPQG